MTLVCVGLALWLHRPFFAIAASDKISNGDFVAYSLRQSERLAGLHKRPVKGLSNLGGMTRIVGMVHDADSQDIILVGKKVAGLPAATLDDLVVALRSRLVNAVWPMVSIDPTDDTLKSGLQSVRFRGGIENTQFGRQFFDCDVVLKKYGLGMLENIHEVASYKELCTRYIKADLVERGGTVGQVIWQSSGEARKATQNFQKREIKEEKSLQCRFWFYPLDSSEVTESDGLLVIPELHLGVKREIISGAQSDPGHKEKVAQDKASDDFSSKFSDNLSAAESKFVALKTMRLLYSMVAVAEGIGHLKGRPTLDYFLYEYEVKQAETPKTYELLEILGVFHQTDGADYVVNISGGLELRAIMSALNGGDVTRLLDAVVKSRPSPTALYWRLPIRGWQLTRDDQRQSALDLGTASVQSEHQLSSSDRIGCSLVTRAYLLGPSPSSDTDSGRRFVGFAPLPPPLAFGTTNPGLRYVPPIRSRGGVDVLVEPNSAGKAESGLKEKVLDYRPTENDFSWSVGKGRKSR